MKNNAYTYYKMKKDLIRLENKYGLSYFSIGKSVKNREIFAFCLGKGDSTIIVNGGHHGLEWITSLLLMRFAEDYLESLANGSLLCGINVNNVYKGAKIYIIPMVNPDGIEMSLSGIEKYRDWQANARGVDLNHNYDYCFWHQKEELLKLGINGPNKTRYGGEFPLSEPESHALAIFTEKICPRLVIAYHSQGEVIYYKNGNVALSDSKRIVKKFSQLSGYMPDETEGIASYGGYKDWFIDKFKKPGFTIEVGIGKNPLPITAIGDIINKNYEIILSAPFL